MNTRYSIFDSFDVYLVQERWIGSKVTSHPQKGGSANRMGTGGTGSYSRTRQEVGLSHMKYDPIRFQTHLLKRGAELAP